LCTHCFNIDDATKCLSFNKETKPVNSGRDQVKEDEMSRACSKYGNEGNAEFWWERQKERNH
jgi:hypothetical protein